MISNYKLNHGGLDVNLSFNADETWINHKDLMTALNEVINLAECCDSFSLTIVYNGKEE